MHGGHENKSKKFHTQVLSILAEQNVKKRFQLRSNDHDHLKTRTKEPIES